jgi:two-component system, NarL family, sensor kinase
MARGGDERPIPSAEVARPLAEFERAVRTSRVALAAEVAVEPDRAKLAYAIHDGLTQVVTASVLELESLARQAEVEPAEATRALHEAGRELRRALEEIREILTALTPPGIEGDDIEETLRNVLDRWGLPATWSVEGDLASVPRPVLDVATSVIREAVTNVAKHAKADRVSVRVQASDHTVQVSIEDHGEGFEDGPAPKGHLGLQMMRRRVSQAHGTLDIGPAPGGGTLVVARLPIADPEDSR